MRDFLRQFMYGRYGSDDLGRFMVGSSMVFLVLWLVTRFDPLSWIVFILLILSYFRIFSRNTSARYAENQKFLAFWGPLRRKMNDFIFRLRDRKVHCYFKCPNCKTRLRVPRGRGKINIKCSRCGTQFVKKT